MSNFIKKTLFTAISLTLGTVIRKAMKISRIEILPSILESRLGHQIVEPLYLELLREAGVLKWNKVLVLWDPDKVANQLALKSLPTKYILVKNKKIRNLLNFLSQFIYTKRYPSPSVGIGAVGQSAEIFKYTHLINDSFQFLSIPNERQRENSIREILGIPKDAWICTLHVREPGAFNDETMHSYRNSDPLLMMLAVEEVTSRGGFVVRIGGDQRIKMPELNNFRQLTQSQSRNGESELILCRSSRFFLGNTSGALTMAASNGVPVVAVNVAPLSALKVWGPHDLAIPKLYRHMATGQLVTFGSVLGSEVGNYRHSVEIRESGYELIDNTSFEIRDLVSEMIDCLDGNNHYSEEDDFLQSTMQALFQTHNYTYFSKTRIGKSFLRHYRHLVTV